MPAQPPPPPAPKKQSPGFYLRFRGQTTGPYSLEQVKDALTQGTVSRLHDVSRDQHHWFPIHTRPAILDNSQSNRAPQPSAASSDIDLSSDSDTPSAPPPSTPPSQDQTLASSDPDTADLIDSILKEPHK
jgi:hypothetical protein